MSDIIYEEVSREEWGAQDSPRWTPECPSCGRKLSLWFNGGELDRARCCHYEFELEHVRIDKVIRRRPSHG